MKLKKNRKSNSKHNKIPMRRYENDVVSIGDKVFIDGEYVGHILKNEIVVFPEYHNQNVRNNLLQLSGELNRQLSILKQ